MLEYTPPMDFSVEIYILRHGQSKSNESNIVCGASDYPLSDKGLNQAETVCKYLSKITFDKVYCSPLTRAQQTISTLNTDVEIVLVPDLIELDTGTYSHITVNELYSIDDRYRYQGLYPDLRYPGGESLNMMISRVEKWFKSNFQKWGNTEKILIAGHEGTICAILHSMLKLHIAHYPTFLIANCDCAVININDDNQIRYRFIPFQGQSNE